MHDQSRFGDRRSLWRGLYPGWTMRILLGESPQFTMMSRRVFSEFTTITRKAWKTLGTRKRK